MEEGVDHLKAASSAVCVVRYGSPSVGHFVFAFLTALALNCWFSLCFCQTSSPVTWIRALVYGWKIQKAVSASVHLNSWTFTYCLCSGCISQYKHVHFFILKGLYKCMTQRTFLWAEGWGTVLELQSPHIKTIAQLLSCSWHAASLCTPLHLPCLS